MSGRAILVTLVLAGACIDDAALVDAAASSTGAGASGGEPMAAVSTRASSSQTASSGGTGGAPVCDPASCPGVDTNCEFRICDDGVCGFDVAPAGTMCTENSGKVCDGLGLCVECVQSSDCMNEPCINHYCGNPKALGEPCIADAQCASGYCPADDGVCCDASCNGPCDACLGAKTCGSDGSCAPVVAGTDPDAECMGGATCFGGACAQGRIAFVSSTAYNGNLGGLSGADAICNNHALTACLPGSYMAWLSTGAASPSTRFNQSAVPYRKVDGTVIAVNYNNLVDGSLDAPLNLDESGDAPPVANFECGTGVTHMAWTGTASNGVAQGTSAGRCAEWTNTSSGGHWGRTDLSNGNWSHWCRGEVQNTCGYTAPVYCFQQ